MAVSPAHPFHWRQATLTEAAQGIFAPDFYPPPTRGLDLQLVWYAVVHPAPRQPKVIIASAIELSKVRICTASLGAFILTDVGPCKPVDESALNLICEHLKV